jgi:type III secretion protein O
MSYELEQLFKVRNHREKKARNRVIRSKAEVNQAREAKESRRQALSDFRCRRLEEERRLVAELTARPGTVQDLLCFNSRVQHLRDRQTEKAKAVATAEEEVAAAETRLQDARRAHAQAYRQQVKIDTHRSLWLQVYNSTLVKAAENEMDACSRTATASGKISL